jgi:hypothetical protein
MEKRKWKNDNGAAGKRAPVSYGGRIYFSIFTFPFSIFNLEEES